MKKIELFTINVDWNKIIDLAFDRKGWGQNYVLYKYGDVVINCVMTDFNFTENAATFKIRAVYQFENTTHDNNYANYMFVKFKVSNYTLEEFKAYMNRRISTLIDEIKERLLKEKAEKKYSEFKHWSFKIKKDEWEKHAKKVGLSKEYEFIKTIDDENLKTSYEDRIEERILEILNEPYNEKVEEYIEKTTINYGHLEKLQKQLTTTTQKNEKGA